MPAEISFPEIYGLFLLLSGLVCFIHFIFLSGAPKKIDPERSIPGWNLRIPYFLIGGIILIFAVLVVQIGTLVLVPADFLADGTPMQIIIFGFATHLTALVALYGLYKTCPAKFQDSLVVRNRSWPGALVVALYSFLVIIPILYPLALGWNLLLNTLGVEPQLQDAVLLFAQVDTVGIMILMVILTVVLAPVSEEILFRGCLYRFLKAKTSLIPALIISGLLFALLHHNLMSFVPLFILGVGLAYAYEQSGDIKVPILIHGIFNLNTVLIIVLSNEIV